VSSAQIVGNTLDVVTNWEDPLAYNRPFIVCSSILDGLLGGETLENVTSVAGDQRTFFARSHLSGRSGDLTVVYQPYWVDSETGTSHGTPYGYDVRVPLFLFGKGIEPGEYLDRASPTDIAPTLAFLCGVTLSRSDGRVLREAVTKEAHATPESFLPR
jgi:hypothetical protein